MIRNVSWFSLAGGALFVWLGLLPGARGDQPAKPELLPPPREAETGVLMPYYRTSRYDVWQLYGVDRTGHFRPRVIYSPCGSFYLYNGEPYPWVTTHQRDFMPYVMD